MNRKSYLFLNLTLCERTRYYSTMMEAYHSPNNYMIRRTKISFSFIQSRIPTNPACPIIDLFIIGVNDVFLQKAMD